jgi:uncharacterized protein
MALTMHRASIPMFKQTLTSLSYILGQAETFCTENKLNVSEFLERRLAPDMFTLTQQIQRATFHSAQAGAKLSGTETPDYDDGEKSFDDLRARIQKTIDFFNTLTPEQFEGSESKELEIMVRVGPLQFIGEDYLFHFAIPQFLFHTTTAYDIIRSAGVEIGKRDFLGNAENR